MHEDFSCPPGHLSILAGNRLATYPRLISFETINFRQLHIYIFFRLQFTRESDMSCYPLEREHNIIIISDDNIVAFKITSRRARIIRIIDVKSVEKNLDKIFILFISS